MVDISDTTAGNVEGDGKDIACTSCDRQASLHQSMGGGKGIQFSLRIISLSLDQFRVSELDSFVPFSRIDVESVGFNR